MRYEGALPSHALDAGRLHVFHREAVGYGRFQIMKPHTKGKRRENCRYCTVD